MSETATMSLPLDLVKPAIEAHVKTAIITALGADGKIFERVVQEIMNTKVDGEGRTGRYGCETPWFTWAINNVIRDAVKVAIVEHISKDKEKITEALNAEMGKSKSPLVRSLVTAMAEGLTTALSNEYRVNVSIDLKSR